MVGVYNEMCYNIIDEIVVGFFGSWLKMNDLFDKLFKFVSFLKLL